MIIKKNKLDKIMGADVQEPEENVNSDFPQEDGYAQSYPQEYNNNTQNPSIENNIEGDNNNLYEEPINKFSEQSDQTEGETNIIQQPLKKVQEPAPTPIKEEINLFDLDNIDFTQRQERRKGNRRRGFRRVDDRNLVSRAREEAESIRENAQKEGYQAGLEQAQADIAEIKVALEQFVNAKQEVFEHIAPDLLEISVDIAQKIIKKEIEQSPEVLINTIVDVLKTSLSKEETKVTLRVNPAEVNEIKQAVPEILNLAGIDTKIVVLSDDEITEGGCQVTTTNGIVDATLEARMGVVVRALRES